MKKLLVMAFLLTVSISAQTQKSAKPHPVETFYLAGIKAFNKHNLDEFTR